MSSTSAVQQQQPDAVIAYLVRLHTEIKMFHWHARSYSRHVISDKLAKRVSPLIDRLIEIHVASVSTQPPLHQEPTGAASQVRRPNSQASSRSASARANANAVGGNSGSNGSNENNMQAARRGPDTDLVIRSLSPDGFDAMLHDAVRTLQTGFIATSIRGHNGLQSLRDDIVVHLTEALYRLRMGP